MRLVLIAGAAYFLLLGRAPLSNPDEGRYAEISREMVATGDWMTPRLDGIHYFEKPPLMYWAVALSEELFGPNEWAVRAVVALFAIAGLLITYLTARTLYGRDAGIWSAVALGTTLLYFALGHILLLDMAVSVLMSAALFYFLLGINAKGPTENAHASDSVGRDGRLAKPVLSSSKDPDLRMAPMSSRTGEPPVPTCEPVPTSNPVAPSRRACFYGFYASAALATMTKGLIGFLIPGAVIFLWLLVFNQWRRLRPLYLPTGLVLFLAIAAPWHIAMALRNPSWAHFYFVHEHFQRFATTAAHRVQPWWFYIPILLLGLFPWTGFLYPALRSSLAGGWTRRKDNADAWFLVTWAVFIVLLFSKSQSKLIPYILPVLPPLAVLIGVQLAKDRGTASEGRDGRPARPGTPLGHTQIRTGEPPVPTSEPVSLTPYVIFTCISWLLAAGLLIAVLTPGVIREPAQAAALQPWAVGLALMLAVWSAISFVVARRAHAYSRTGGPPVPTSNPADHSALARLSPLSCVLATTSILLGVLVIVRPAIDIRGTKTLGLKVAALAQPEDRIYSYDGFFPDFLFYSQRQAGLVNDVDADLEPGNDDPAAMARIFISDAEFRSEWEGPNRVFAVARRQSVKELFADPAFHYRLLGEDPGHYLFSNR